MTVTHAAARRRILPKNAVIFSQGEPGGHSQLVEEGVVRLCLYLPYGQRVIAGFAFPGDLIGVAEDRHVVTAEAATSVMLHDWGADSAGESGEEIRMLARALRQAYMVLAIRSRRHARSRIAAFLVGLADRGLGTEFRLPVPLIDLADHLGLTLHTISRTLGELRRQGVLRQARGRLLTILEPDQLRAIANEAAPSRMTMRMSTHYSGMTH